MSYVLIHATTKIIAQGRYRSFVSETQLKMAWDTSSLHSIRRLTRHRNVVLNQSDHLGCWRSFSCVF